MKIEIIDFVWLFCIGYWYFDWNFMMEDCGTCCPDMFLLFDGASVYSLSGIGVYYLMFCIFFSFFMLYRRYMIWKKY